MKISAIIVVYNKDISRSVTFKNIKAYGGIDVFVVDNSTNENQNKAYSESNHAKYLSMSGNKGLSKAYNTAINMLTDSDLIVILDDDTDVPVKYFDELKKQVEMMPDCDIFVPIIKGQNGIIYSPNNYSFLKNKLVTDPVKEVRQDRFNAISSCMAIRMRVFDDYRYNEKLFVDEVDHCFCREQRAIGRKFGILNVEIEQKFHQREAKIAADSAWKRERIRIVDIFRHARIIGKRQYISLAFVKCCGLGVQIGKKSRSLAVVGKAFALSSKLLFVDE